MNKAASIVSDALLGMDFKNVEIGGRVYTIKPPTIKTICRAVRHFSFAEMSSDNLMKAIDDIPENSVSMLNGLSCFICGTEKMADKLANGTYKEAKDALKACFSLIDDSAFQCVSLMMNVSSLAGKPKQ